MQGPNHTSKSPEFAPLCPHRVFTVFSITPCANPRQPAWAAATAVPFESVNKIGKQSATMMVHAKLISWVKQASAIAPSGVAG
jgi:hypothetical protein